MLQIIYFTKSEKTKKNGECPIYAKIQYQKQTITMSAKQSISVKRWNFTNNLRNPLKFEKIVNQLVKDNTPVNINYIKKDIIGKPKKNKEIVLIDIFDIHNKEFKRKVDSGERSAASLQKYKRSRGLNKKFLETDYPRGKP